MSLAHVADPSRRTLYSALGAALFILSLGALDPLTRGAVDFPALIPPFGASTVIVFFAPDTAASRAWNVVLGHLGSALVALGLLMLLPDASTSLQAALAVSLAAVFMVATRSIHPPGGATALLTVLTSRGDVHLSDLVPLLLGCLTLVSIRRLLDAVLAWSARRGDAENAAAPAAAPATSSIPTN